MDEDQVKETVSLVMTEFHYYKPEDFKLCFTKAKKGHYGIIYNRIDCPVIFGWLNAYDLERCLKVEELQAAASKEFKEVSKALLPDESSDSVLQKNLDIWKERLEKNKVAKPDEDKQKPQDNPVYRMHQRWFKQFDTLYYKNPIGKQIRMIYRYGRKLDINGYLEHKQYQYNLFTNRYKSIK